MNTPNDDEQEPDMSTYEKLIADGTLTPEAAFGPEPGTGYVTDAKTGRVFLAHLPPPPEPVIRYVPAPPELPSVPAPVQGRDPWTARIGMGMGGTAAVVVAVGHYAHGLGEFAHQAEGAGIAIGVAAAGLALWKGSAPKVSVNVTANITGATAHGGHGGNAEARSGSGWKSRTS